MGKEYFWQKVFPHPAHCVFYTNKFELFRKYASSDEACHAGNMVPEFCSVFLMYKYISLKPAFNAGNVNNLVPHFRTGAVAVSLRLFLKNFHFTNTSYVAC